MLKISQENIINEDGTVTKGQIAALLGNYFDRMRKLKGTLSRKLTRQEDTRCVWFSKSRLDELFIANGWTPEGKDTFGLRVYYGVHKKDLLKNPKGEDMVKAEYHNQQTVVLVVTRNSGTGGCDQDQLNDKNFIDIAGVPGKPDTTMQPGMGLNHGKLCPPEVCDGTEV